MKELWSPGVYWALSAGTVAAVFVVWQFSSMQGWISPQILPSPLDILESLVDVAQVGYLRIPLWKHWSVSLGRALVAFLAAIAIGIPLGLFMGMFRGVRAVIDPFVQFLRPVPKLALIPLIIVWFGIGELSKFVLIFIATFTTIVVGATASVGHVRMGYLRVAQSLGATPLQQFRVVMLPHALPELFISVRLAIGIGWTTLIAAEMIAASSGIGWMVLNASAFLRTDIVILGILLLGATGYALDAGIVALQRTIVPWMGRE